MSTISNYKLQVLSKICLCANNMRIIVLLCMIEQVHLRYFGIHLDECGVFSEMTAVLKVLVLA